MRWRYVYKNGIIRSIKKEVRKDVEIVRGFVVPEGGRFLGVISYSLASILFQYFCFDNI